MNLICVALGHRWRLFRNMGHYRRYYCTRCLVEMDNNE
jgi:hypothetical protein